MFNSFSSSLHLFKVFKIVLLVILKINVFRSGSKVMDRSRISQTSQESSCELREGHEMATEEKYLHKFEVLQKLYIIFNFSTLPTITLLKPNTAGTELVEAMKHPANGLSFINSQQNLPNFTFVTADAVNWLMTHMEGVTSVEKGVQVLKNNLFNLTQIIQRVFFYLVLYFR